MTGTRIRRAIVATAVASLAAVAPAQAGTLSVPRNAALTLTGSGPGDATGTSVAPAGDVNGDGRNDVIVGAPLADPAGRVDGGSAYVVLGGGARGRLDLGGLGARGFRTDGAVPLPSGMRHVGNGPLTSGAGAVVSGLGDVNGDGLGDVAVSGREAGPLSGSSRTVVFVVFGKRDTQPVDLASLGDRGFVIRPGADGTEVVAGYAAGRFNGDGLADIAVRTFVDGDEDAGRVDVVPGTRTPGPVQVGEGTITFMGGFAGMQLGAGIAPAGDVNGDGIGDLLLGAPGASRHGENRGAVFTVFGRAQPPGAVLRTGRRFGGFETDGVRAGAAFGFSVARFGRGFVAGAPGSPLTGAGESWIVPRRNGKPTRLPGTRTGGPAGVAVAAPGDVTGDGRADVLVVSRGRRDRAAPVTLFSGRTLTQIHYTGLRNATEARVSASGAGNVLGDARPELVFGSPGANAVYVVTGR